MEVQTVSRRRFLTGAGASLAAPSSFDAFAQNACPQPRFCATSLCASPKIPDYTQPGTRPFMLARYRPHREGTYRLEKLKIGEKWIVHNYGHSGAGITMSLGCAEQVVALVEQIIAREGADFARSGIAVLGGGVMGLTAARALVHRYFPGIKIDVFTDKTYKETTSHVAGGQWAPSSVQWEKHKPQEHQRFKTILSVAKRQFTELGAAYGVFPRINFTLFDENTSGLEIAADLGIICKHRQDPLPFANMNNTRGFAYETLLVEPPVFLRKIHKDVLDRITEERFHHPHVFAARKDPDEMSADIVKLRQKVIINCTGLGAERLFKDEKQLRPHKGQLVLLPPQKLDYLFSGYRCGNGWAQYMFPRSDYLVLGGTYQGRSIDEKENRAVGIHIANSLKQLFERGAQECAPNSPDRIESGPGV